MPTHPCIPVDYLVLIAIANILLIYLFSQMIMADNGLHILVFLKISSLLSPWQLALNFMATISKL